LNIKLRRKGFRSSLIEKAMDELKSLGYINDRTFAEEYIEEKKKRSSWGSKLIEAGLKKKGIQRDIINNSLTVLPAEELKEQAKKLLVKKYRYRTFTEIEALKLKMCSFLISKGYDYEISESAVDEYIDLHKMEA
jgi:regulatory protein